jgi:hypothetical protein
MNTFPVQNSNATRPITPGTLLYWMTTILAGLITAMATANFYFSASEGEPTVPIVALLVAGVIWLIGWACRNALAER